MSGVNFELGIGDGHPQKKRTASHNFGPKCKATLFACTVILLSVALSGMYLEARLGQIEKRLVKDFEHRLDEIKRSFEMDLAAETNAGEFSEEDFLDEYSSGFPIEQPRSKRQAETPQIPALHTGNITHGGGIASARIAVLYADQEEVERRNASVGISSKLKMRPNPGAETPPACNSSFTNTYRDGWCRRNGVSKDIFQLQSRSYNYMYFAQASWMNTTESSQYYSVDTTDSGVQKIEVKQSGMYIIASSMRFTELRAAENVTLKASYSVYVDHHSTGAMSKVGNCAHVHRGTGGDNGSKVFPCPTWQLVPLQKYDKVYMRINTYIWFEVRKETMFLAVIKLNDDLL